MTPRPAFDGLAPHYRWLEAVSFGPLLHRCRIAMLPQLRDARRALLLGDGNGRFLADFVTANPQVDIDAIDVSRRMTELARGRVATVPGAAERVRFHVADARTFPFPAGRYDLIVTNFFLDCFPRRELGPLIARLSGACKPDGRWVVGDFRMPNGGWERVAARAALAGMYGFFRVVTRIPAGRLVDPDPLLRGHGFELCEEATWLCGFLAARLWVRV